jgi:beta-galactosidase
VTVVNDGTSDASFEIQQVIVDADDREITKNRIKNSVLKPGESRDFTSVLTVANPKLWSLETPYLHKLVSTVISGGKVVDHYETTFGIRTIRFDANEGFFLNGKHVKLQGTNNHQDHAGVGNAVPDSLLEFRMAKLKEMGSNAYRTSHNPPSPELLDICDRVGMLVLDEHRMMGTSPEIMDQLKRLIVRDRNHPSVILWSVGNEEWALEWSETGKRLTTAMQAYVKRLDPTRRVTVAVSGSGGGNSLVTDVFGFNYYMQNDIDKMHSMFPDRPVVGTEESSSNNTRGVYVEDREHQHLVAYDHKATPKHATVEEAWTFHASRPFSAGMFIWTGFDYRGEPTPFGWPAVSSQFGLLDTCGFFKDNAYYLQSWWKTAPMLHLLPHWNWQGKEGQVIDVRAYSNAEEVELSLNGRSLGRKSMRPNSHLQWDVKYEPGTLIARGYAKGKEVAHDSIETTGPAAALQLIPNESSINADSEDVSVVTVRVNDAKQRMVPTAENEVSFSLSGSGRIIGVGNGDPSSHEPDRYVESVSSIAIGKWRMMPIDTTADPAVVTFDFDDTTWKNPFERGEPSDTAKSNPAAIVYRGVFELSDGQGMEGISSLLLNTAGERQSVYVNGKLVASGRGPTTEGHTLDLDRALLRTGKNVVSIIVSGMAQPREMDRYFGWNGNGLGQVRVTKPAGTWKRNVFNGLAQVIVQSKGEPGKLTLKASSPGVSDATVMIDSVPANPRAAVTE